MPSSMPSCEDVHYAQLARGARFLADGADSPAERDLHLNMADKYARLSANAAHAGRCA